MALGCTWGGYAETDIELSTFFSANHTIAVRFMPQYPNAYEGPMVSVQGTGTLVLGQGDFLAAPSGQQKVILRVGSGQINPSVQLAAGTWHHLAAVRSGNTYTRAGASVSNRFMLNWLFSYQPVPGTVFFAGYGSNLTESDAFTFRDLHRTTDGFFIKLTYLFRL